ncbi:MAG: hydrogenase maturation nickel metallochaperone HypA [Pseudomonadota bacterium]|jgi:hydrogenase nickel incorporation protein HypA/HybF
MHELSLCHELARMIAERAASEGFTRVRRVVLEIGGLSHVLPDAMAFGFDVATRGGPADGATLDILRPPGTAWCADCDAQCEIAARGDGCPSCGGHRLLVTGGDELRLKELEVL